MQQVFQALESLIPDVFQTPKSILPWIELESYFFFFYCIYNWEEYKLCSASVVLLPSSLKNPHLEKQK